MCDASNRFYNRGYRVRQSLVDAKQRGSLTPSLANKKRYFKPRCQTANSTGPLPSRCGTHKVLEQSCLQKEIVSFAAAGETNG